MKLLIIIICFLLFISCGWKDKNKDYRVVENLITKKYKVQKCGYVDAFLGCKWRDVEVLFGSSETKVFDTHEEACKYADGLRHVDKIRKSWEKVDCVRNYYSEDSR